MDKDLFTKPSAKTALLHWMLERNWTRSSEVLAWGVRNFSNRALRNAQELMKEGRFRRMTDEEKAHVFGPIKEEVFVRQDYK